MSDNGNGMGWPTGPTYNGLFNGLTQGIEGFLRGRQMRDQTRAAALAATRQDALAQSLMQRRADETNQGNARLDPNAPLNALHQGNLEGKTDSAEEAADRAAAQELNNRVADMWGKGIDPSEFVRSSLQNLSPRARNYFLGGPDASTSAPAAPTLGAPPTGLPPAIGAPAGPGAMAPPMASAAVSAPPAPPSGIPTLGPPPIAPGVPGGGAPGASSGPWWSRPNPAHIAAAVDPYVKEYGAALASEDFAKLPPSMQDARVNGWRQQIRAQGGDPDALGVISPVQGGKSSLVAPPKPEDPAAKMEHEKRQTQIEVWKSVILDQNATGKAKQNAMARLNKLFGAETGAPPVQAEFSDMTAAQRAEIDLHKKGLAQQAENDAAGRALQSRGLAQTQAYQTWEKHFRESGGAENPAYMSIGQLMEARTGLHKAGAPTQQIGEDGKSFVNVPGAAPIDSPQGKAQDAWLNSVIYAKAHGLPIPQPPSGASAPAPASSLAGAGLGLMGAGGGENLTGTLGASSVPTLGPPPTRKAKPAPPPINDATGDNVPDNYKRKGYALDATGKWVPVQPPKPGKGGKGAAGSSRTYGGFTYTVTTH